VTGDDDRIAYLAGEGGGLSDPEQRADLDELRSLLADPSLWAEPGPDLEDRLVASIGEEATLASGLAMETQPVPSRRRHRRLLVVAGGVAAAVAAAVALTIGLRSSGPAPLHFQAALAGTSLAPGASGHATLTKTNAGWRVVLHATGLARLDNGQFYQAWLKNQAGTLVPIGTFNQGPTVMLWSGVSPQSFPTVTVTEQMAGNPASSGRRVLVGTVDLHS
jgi:Anti-sigma-K factor rskA